MLSWLPPSGGSQDFRLKPEATHVKLDTNV